MTGDQDDSTSIGQELYRKVVKLVHDIPLHRMLAMVENVEIDLRKLRFEQRCTLKGVAAVVFAEDHEQRAGEIDQSLPRGFGILCGATALARLAPL